MTAQIGNVDCPTNCCYLLKVKSEIPVLIVGNRNTDIKPNVLDFI